MNELYEIAKQVDVLVLFCFLMGFSCYGIISGIMEIIFFIHDRIKKHIVKKNGKKESTEK